LSAAITKLSSFSHPFEVSKSFCSTREVFLVFKFVDKYSLPIFSFVGVDGAFTGVTLVGELFDGCAAISPSTPDPAIFFFLKKTIQLEKFYDILNY
jgi:hypothetical protein